MYIPGMLNYDGVLHGVRQGEMAKNAIRNMYKT